MPALSDLALMIQSRHPFIAVDTSEEDRLEMTLAQVAGDLRVPFFVWTVTNGLHRYGLPNAIYDSQQPLKGLNSRRRGGAQVPGPRPRVRPRPAGDRAVGRQGRAARRARAAHCTAHAGVAGRRRAQARRPAIASSIACAASPRSRRSARSGLALRRHASSGYSIRIRCRRRRGGGDEPAAVVLALVTPHAERSRGNVPAGTSQRR
jgi:hypothetical protein